MATASNRWHEPVRRACTLLALAWAGAAMAADPPAATLALVLRTGDTLVGITERYLEPIHDWQALQRFNRIADPRKLQPGAQLQIPLAWLRWTVLPVEVVHVRAPVTGNRGPLAVGMQLTQGDSFDTGMQGAITLRFADGALAAFAPQTRATLGLARETPFGGVTDTRIDLERGAVETTVTPLRTPASRFDVRTPRVVTAVRGTRFRVAQDEQASRHEVLEGRVAAQGERPDAVEIVQGSGLRAQGGQLGDVVRLLPAPDLSSIPQRIERTSQLLQVPAMAGATGWRWQVARDGAFVQREQEARTFGPTWLLAGLPDGEYQLRVRAADAQSLEGADAQTGFVLQARPEPPLRVSPPDGASVLAGTPLVWADVSGSSRYRLQVARDAQFADQVLDQAGIHGARHGFEPGLAPGLYHWRLATERTDGSPGPWGDPSRFTVLEPSSMAPPQQGPSGLQLDWSGPAGFRHQVQLSRSPDFAQPDFDEVVAGTRLNLAQPQPGAYHVRTRLVLPDGSLGPWSAVQRFEVAEPPKPPSHPWYLLLFLLLPLL